MKKSALTLAIATLICGSAIASEFRSPEHAVKYRQKAFSLMAHNFGDMGDMLKGKKEFDADKFAKRAANVAALSHIPAEGFEPGTDKGETDALPKIWDNMDDFNKRLMDLQTDAAALAKVSAEKGDKRALGQAFKNVAQNCKGCHDTYKKD
ncbi:c-type cytochrome [Paraferrimonas sedimenticola]|uniref:Cytochrome c n=1 Tax=Paraferrimonas sedimenticola TaxID=375674 RepID=A0AA37W219_9GAMM|nr:cytochrome c [Paraferrimonas sedimenticola]GLP97167.1 cytochrome c [Paraferrimonas sedimenticola]